MAFEIQDFFRAYTKTGQFRGLFNVARSDEVADSPRYYLYLSESGSYVVQRITDTAGVKVYDYYARGTNANFSADWTDRVNLAYVEYNLLFRQS